MSLPTGSTRFWAVQDALVQWAHQRSVSVSKCLNERDKVSPELGRWHTSECFNESEPIGCCQEFGEVIRASRGMGRLSNSAVKEKRRANFQRFGKKVQTARPDSVFSFLILLDLLERHPDRRSKIGLAHS